MNARKPAGLTGVAVAGVVVLGWLAAADPAAATTPSSTDETTTTVVSSTSTTTLPTLPTTSTTSTTVLTTPPTSVPLGAVTATLTAGCSNGVGFVDAEISTSIVLTDVQIQLFRMFHDPQPFDSVVIGDMAAGDTYSTRFLVDGGFTYSLDVIVGTEFVAGSADGMNPCVSPAPPPPAPVAEPSNTLPSTR